MTPDLLIIGQITIDHVVPALPGPWEEALGGNALYAAAGARLWIPADRIGLVARRGPNLPASIATLMRNAGLAADGLVQVDDDNLVEWMLYETDGSRRNIPRLPELRALAPGDIQTSTIYLDRKALVSATADDIPLPWRQGARAIHLAPQVKERHPTSLAALADGSRLISVDPSPTYSQHLSAAELAKRLSGASIFAPSQAEVAHLLEGGDWADLAIRLAEAGFPEVVIKLGDKGVAVVPRDGSRMRIIAAAPVVPVDLTGAGDAFCGAYLANRLLGLAPVDAARRATVAAGMVVECVGVDAALALKPAEARRRLECLPAPAEDMP